MSNSSSEIERTLMALLRSKHGVQQEIHPTTKLLADLGLESIQIIEYLCEVEDHFDLAIDEDSLADVQTIADLAHVVARISAR